MSLPAEKLWEAIKWAEFSARANANAAADYDGPYEFRTPARIRRAARFMLLAAAAREVLQQQADSTNSHG